MNRILSVVTLALLLSTPALAKKIAAHEKPRDNPVCKEKTSYSTLASCESACVSNHAGAPQKRDACRDRCYLFCK